jgi:hypothetical protein
LTSLYTPSGDGIFASTEYTRGPWDPGLQHAGPPAALLAHVAAATGGLTDGQFTQLAYDILRPVPLAELRVSARVLRPGRRVEQLEASLTAVDGDPDDVLMRLTAWRMRREAVELPAGVGAIDPPPPGPDGLEALELPFWPRKGEIAYKDALEWRLASGIVNGPGPACVWTRTAVTLLEGEPITPLEHLVVMSDAASGVSATLDWLVYGFLNVDYSLHLGRVPEGDWMAMDAVTRPGPEGAGQCSATLFDRRGRLGVSTQSLLVTRR